MIELCRRFGVRRLEVFGSATTDAFDPERSDVDLLAEFENTDAGTYADRYFAMREAVTALLERDVDLLTPGSIENPYIRRSIEKSKRLLYAA